MPGWHYAGSAAPTDLLEKKRDEMVAFTAANIAANEFMSDPANKEAVLDTAEEVTGIGRDILSETYDTFLEDGLFPSDNGYPEGMVGYTADQQVELGNIDESESRRTRTWSTRPSTRMPAPSWTNGGPFR